MSKPALIRAGFLSSHFRSKSWHQDENRGFGEYAFLTLDTAAKILKAKLNAGFPHIGVLLPAKDFDDISFDLCRYNVAMTRQLKRGNKSGFPESVSNGRYYPGKQIPIARTLEEKRTLLEKHYPSTMIEVLVPGHLELSDKTIIRVFSIEDQKIAQQALKVLNCNWAVECATPPGTYNRSSKHSTDVDNFIKASLIDPNWRGDGLEFDRL